MAIGCWLCPVCVTSDKIPLCAVFIQIKEWPDKLVVGSSFLAVIYYFIYAPTKISLYNRGLGVQS